jgi:L-asparaginase/Glu-tRNA(Gln) amidotransferase subunit D
MQAATLERAEEEESSLIEFAETVSDTSLKSYDELVQEVLQSEKFEKFKRTLKERHDPKRTNMVILGTGGTFQSAETDHGLAPDGSLEKSFQAMRMPYNRKEINLNLFELFNYDSSLLTTGDQIRFVAEVIIQLISECEDSFDGIIITHGTDTMVETANYLPLILGRGLKKPVILTGSQDPARKKHSDATYNMENCLKVMEFVKTQNIAEVMVLCGNELVRGAWAIKISDRDSDAFASFNKKPLLDVSNRLVKNWKVADFALRADPTVPFIPFNRVTQSADIPVEKLADISTRRLASLIVENRISVFTLLGSATCPNTHAEIIIEASRRGKPIVLRSPFHDSVLRPGTYAAGSALKGSNIPQVKGTDSFIKAKLNFLWHYLGLESESKKGLGEVLERQMQERFYAMVSQNLAGEWFNN